MQLNPAFEMDQTLGEMAANGIIMLETARFFGKELQLSTGISVKPSTSGSEANPSS